MALVHHELCFGCGRTNLFGLLLEARRRNDNVIAGRCFIKQDHQGADRGQAHEGVIAAALGEAMALACGTEARAHAITVGYLGAAPVGEFIEVQAQVVELMDGEFTVTATAEVGGEVVAKSRGTYALPAR